MEWSRIWRDMRTFRENGATVALTALRICTGIIMVVHGGLKLSDPAGTQASFEQAGIPSADLAVYLAIAGELFGGLGLLIGLLTPIAALGPACAMIAAIAFVHLGNGLLAQNGGWEYPLVLFWVSLYFVFRGAGPVSVDALFASWRAQRRSGGARPSGMVGVPRPLGN